MISKTGAALITFSFFGLIGLTINFDNLKPTSFPPYWTAVTTRPQEPARWEVLRDSTAPSRPNVFARVSGVPNNSEYALAVFDKVICRDGDLSVKFKIASGARRVKTAGIVWRYQDPRNYYLLDFNADDKNIGLVRVENGQRHPIPLHGGKPGGLEVPHDLRTGQWYVAKVVFRGDSIRVLFDNRQLFDAVDASLSTPGKTGLWTRGGTEASFDDFRIDRKG
ncbi:MAG TPA: family 16 glycoside hydrolase [Bryobacteraceae bacterium]|nr:family 16 glycoside hydrolase [Bryobacteraceae bacterium]